MTAEDLLELIVLEDISDIFLSENKVPYVRKNAEVSAYGSTPLPPGSITAFRTRILPDSLQEFYARHGSADCHFTTRNNRRFRINFYSSSSGDSAALRPVKCADDLSFEDLGLPAVLKQLTFSQRGLILVCGSTGSGKSTTLAAMVNHINTHFRKKASI